MSLWLVFWFFRFHEPLRTVFDEIFARLTPDSILRDARATGEGVAVAVIDSGVERAVLEEKFRLAGTPILPIEGAMFRPGMDRRSRTPATSPARTAPRSRTSS